MATIGVFKKKTHSDLDIVCSNGVTGDRVGHFVFVVVQMTVGTAAFQFKLDDVQESSRVGIVVHIFDMPIDVFRQQGLQLIAACGFPHQNGGDHLEQDADHRYDAVLCEEKQLVLVELNF